MNGNQVQVNCFVVWHDICAIGSIGSLSSPRYLKHALSEVSEPFRVDRHFIYSTFKQKLTGSALETAHLRRSCQRRKKGLQYMKLKGVLHQVKSKINNQCFCVVIVFRICQLMTQFTIPLWQTHSKWLSLVIEPFRPTPTSYEDDMWFS